MLTLRPPPPLVLPASARCDQVADLTNRGDARALDKLGLETALRNHVLPLAPAGAVTPVAVESRADFHRLEPHLRVRLGPVAPRIYTRQVIEAEVLRMRNAHLVRRAEERAPSAQSCRTWSGGRLALGSLVACCGLAALATAFPGVAIWLVTLWAAVTLMGVTGLRVIAAIAQIRYRHTRARIWRSTRSDARPDHRLPKISLLVPLYKERDIAGPLIKRLSRLDYPHERLEVCLILEWGDRDTEAALRAADLPDWMRIVEVPGGHLRTKPRAMNYALDFLSGEIIGIYDAEDAPAADQLRLVATGFARAPANVACLQGVLDFYNSQTNWLTRCFTIDYAVWFRLILPGLEKLGIVIPLGGTTVFFRRSALETLGRWDAHNVTEDADLGLRLARHGYRCAFIQTTTEEEATSTIPAWIRQRSRWIKGYAMTWAVHMRDPLRLLGELGPLRFLCVQILFLGTLSQFVLAPLLWSFWLILFGVAHPFPAHAPWEAVIGLGVLFFISEIATLTLAALAVATPRHRWLIKWVPLMHLYFPLAAVASWKGFAELVARPFFWDKTAHGRDKAQSPRLKPPWMAAPAS
ncbi:MAG: glycosyltransferase family 2 protein [Paracoccaceae bacterium]|nr:glycosyltransferase family 2 protein [Paracoccaceae bacterium]